MESKQGGSERERISGWFQIGVRGKDVHGKKNRQFLEFENGVLFKKKNHFKLVETFRVLY